MKKIIILTLAVLISGCKSGSVVDNYERKNKPLEFSVSKSASGFESNTLFTLENEKDNPTVILMHSCAGIHPGSVGDLKRWKNLLIDNGFNVLVMDHLSSRGVSKNCSGKNRPITMTRLVRDVYDATDFLKDQPGVDSSRIFTLGFSLGAMTGGSAASALQYRYQGDSKPRPRAVAGLYGGCHYGGPTYYLDYDTDLPVLWLMGERDGEAPVQGCTDVSKALLDKGLLTYHVYPEATHCWDCRGLDGFSKVAANGVRVTYRYSDSYTRDSEKRVLEFFNSFPSKN